MQVNVQDISSIQKKLAIVLGNDDVSMYREQVTKKVISQAKIPGFRPGKAPRSVVEQRFESVILEDTIQAAIRGSIGNAIEQSKLRVVGNPDVQVDKFETNQLAYSATVEIYPDLKLTKENGFDLEAPVVLVTEVDIEDTIEKTRKSFAEITPVLEVRPVRGGDICIVDFKGTVDGVEFDGGTGTNLEVEIGSGNFFPGFEEGMLGHKVGEKFVVDVTIPETFQDKNLAGKAAKFDIALNDLKTKKLPEFDQELFDKLGVKSLEEWKTDIRSSLKKDRETRRRSTLKDQLVEKLIEANAFEVPKAMVRNQQQALAERAITNLRQNYKGITDDAVKQVLGNWMKDIEKDAEKTVRAYLILDHLMTKHKIECTDQDLTAKFEELAKDYDQTPDQIKDYYERRNTNALEQLRSSVKEDKIVQELLSRCKIHDK